MSLKNLLAVVTAAASMLVFSSSASAGREIPVGGANVNDQPLSSASYRLAIRFVLDRDTTLARFVSGFKAEGAGWWPEGRPCSGPGPGCYGAGNGGRIRAQLVTIRADGTPDLGHVLASETFSPRARYAQSAAAWGLSGETNLLWYVNTRRIRLTGDTMYAMVYSNVDRDPLHNFTSINSPDMKESAAGPNGRNTLDPNAPGAVAGLDPREALAWSADAGVSWTWGREVGPYFGDPTGDDGTRLPWYGYQRTAAGPVTPVQPYYSYLERCTGCTLKLHGAPRAVTLTSAGGYAPDGASVGVVTVRNLRTGRTATTAPLGGGMATGALNRPVAIAAGDTYTVRASGTVFENPADRTVRSAFGIGGASTPFPFTTGRTRDRAELYALPHPWFNRGPALAARKRHRRTASR